MKVRFWGVRGSIAVSGPRYVGTGGNTATVEVEHEGERLILDGGTGLRALGDHIGRRPVSVFPITLDALTAKVDCIDIPVDRPFEIGPFSIQPIDLNHPDGVLAYRITAGGRSIVYATDTEHGAALDLRLLRLAEGADLLIHDAQYTTDEYEGRGGPSRRGWGHSTWQQAVAAAQASQVRRLALFHHDPGRDDAGVAQIEAAAQARHPGAAAAREGEVWAL